MRIGICPTQGEHSDHRPARVTVCVPVFIPNQLGYYAHRFDVLKLCLRSIIAHTAAGTYDLLVLDNGSCSEVVEYLQTLLCQGQIHYLMLLGRNIGKLNACRLMFEAAPGEVIAYNDDDVFFCPGWLEAQLEVLDTFPRVGMVSGRPVRKQFKAGNGYLTGYLSEFAEVNVKHGHFIPDEWEAEYLRSTGCRADGVEDIKRKRTDILLEYKNVRAYSTAAHFQFVAPRLLILESLRQGLAPSALLVGGERKFEEVIDSTGYARLSTFGRYVRHIGNVVTAELLDELGNTLPTVEDLTVFKPPTPLLVRLTRPRLARAVLSRLNRWSYLLLYHPEP
jgi:glycosyltransferase involved in cell wall biosynthesis